MSNILSYPGILEVSPEDLLIISDISEEGNPTRTVTVQALVGGSTAPLSLVVNRTLGDATLINNVLNIPNYSSGGTVTNVTYTTDIGAFTANVTNSTSAPIITLNLNGGTAGQFLQQDGEWATPAGSGGVTSVNVTTPGVSTGTPIIVNPTTGNVLVQSMAYAGTTKVGHVPTGGGNTTFLRGDGTWVAPSGSGTMSSWRVDDGGWGGFQVTNNDSVTVGGSTKILVATNPAAKSITWTHADTARTDTTSTASPAAGATFTVVDSITQDATGHPTAVNVKTVTMPAGGGTGTTYDLASAQDGTNVDITLTPSTGAVDTVQLTAGTGITLADDGNNNITIISAASGTGLWTANGNDIYNNNSRAVLVGRTGLIDTGAIMEVEGRISMTTNSYFIGLYAGENSTGSANTGFGLYALRALTSAMGNTAIGSSALMNTTSSGNTAVGALAGQSITTGSGNTAIGRNSLQNNTTGASNVAIGEGAMQDCTTAAYNTVVGENAYGSAAATGVYNVIMGTSAMQNSTTGSYTVCIGGSAMDNNITGSHNTVIGAISFASNLTGSYNVTLGQDAGNTVTNSGGFITAPNNSMYLGVSTKSAATNATNEIVIGYNASGKGTNTVVLGNDDIEKTYLKGVVVLEGGAFAALPASPVAGMRTYIVDGSTPTYGGNASGGGSNVLPVFYNGTNWIYA